MRRWQGLCQLDDCFPSRCKQPQSDHVMPPCCLQRCNEKIAVTTTHAVPGRAEPGGTRAATDWPSCHAPTNLVCPSIATWEAVSDGTSNRSSAPVDWNKSQSDLHSGDQSVVVHSAQIYRHCELLIELQSVVSKVQKAFSLVEHAPFTKQVSLQ